MNKTNRRTFIGTSILIFCAPGCALFNGTDYIGIASTIAFTAAEIGTVAAIRADSSQRYNFEAALGIMDRLTKDENYSAEALARALRATTLPIFRGDTGALIAGALVSVFELSTNTEYSIESPKAVKRVLEAIKTGIRNGLSVTKRKWRPSIAPTYAIHPIHRVKL